MSTTPVGPTGSPQAGTSQPWVVRVAGRISAILHRRLPTPIVATLATVLLVAFLVIIAIAIPGLRTTMRGREGNAVTSLQMVNEAESAYARAYNVGYSHTLAGLGEPLGGGRPLDSGANVAVRLGSGFNNGYRLTYTPRPPDKAGHIQTYIVNARPLEYGKSGLNNYFTDQSGVTRWTSEDRPASVLDAVGGRAENQASAVGHLAGINTAEIMYAETYKAGYSPTLAALGPPRGDSPPSAAAAGFIDRALAGGRKSGYTFTYTPGPKDGAGHMKSYTVTARPVNNLTGTNNYLTDQTGVIRQTSEDRPAAPKDPAIWGQER